MTPRQVRADAQRNRERLLQAAAKAFARGGGEVALEAIAKDAGVGLGTLYRHFPTREALVEATYRDQLARVADSAGELLETLGPERALREWMGRFVAFLTTKHGMADALRAVIAAGSIPTEGVRTLLEQALATLLGACVQAGVVRTDAQPFDVLTGLSGLSLATRDAEQVERLLDLLMDALRYRG